MAPTQGAKLPSMPILIELGIKPFANICGSLVSNIRAPVSFAAVSKAAGLIACCPLSSTLSILS